MVLGSIPVEVRFSVPPRPVSCPPSPTYNGYRFFPRVKRPDHGSDHPPPSEKILQITIVCKLYIFLQVSLNIICRLIQIFLQVWSEYTLKPILSLDTRSWKMFSNFTLQHAMAQRGSRDIPVIINLGSRWVWVMKYRSPTALPAGESPCTDCTVGWVRFRVRPDGCGKEKIYCHHWSMNPEPSNEIILVERIFSCDPWNSITFRRFRNIVKSFVMSVRPHGTTRLPLDRFSWNLLFEYFRKSVEKVPFQSQPDKNKGYFTWRPIYVFDNMSFSSS